jgi:hypothetical protein
MSYLAMEKSMKTRKRPEELRSHRWYGATDLRSFGHRSCTTRRRLSWTPPRPRFERGYGVLSQLHVLQADKGCDFDFLEEPIRTQARAVVDPETY